MSLQSLADQTYKNIEVIVVDDGSTEEAQLRNTSTVEEFKNQGLKIKLINLEKNSGTVSIPRNIGISHADGEILAHIDDDCISRSSKFERLVPLISETVVLAYGGRIAYSLINGEVSLKGQSSTNMFVKDKKALGIDNGQFIYRTDVYNHIDPVFAINACDWETYKLIADLGDFAYCPNMVCSYYWHGNNISLTPKPQRVHPHWILTDYIKYFRDNKFKDKVIQQL
jgi:glycosyltransferase involved in cell wall biosynthesis